MNESSIKRLYILSSLLIAALTPAGSTAAPALSIDTPSYNFGIRDSASVVTNTFRVRNNGDQPLLIKETKESCGCTVSKIEEKNIPPGSYTEIKVMMTLKGMAGPVKKHIHIISNDPERVRTITMEGTAMARTALEPPALSFGRIDPRNPPAPTQVRLTGYITNAVISKLSMNTNIFKVVKAADARSLIIHPPLDVPPGACKQQVIVETSDEKSPKLVLSVFAYTTPPIRFVPRTISIPKSDANAKRWIMLKPGSAGKFKLLEVNLSAPFATIKIDQRPASSYHVILSQIKTEMINAESTLTIVTDIPGQQKITIPVKVLD